MFTQILVALAVTAVLLLFALLILTFIASKRAQSHRNKEIIVMREASVTDDVIWDKYSTLTDSLMQNANANFSIVGIDFYDGYEVERPDCVLVATNNVSVLFDMLLPHLGDHIRLIATPETVDEANLIAGNHSELTIEIITGSTDEITEQVKALF